MKSTYIKPIHLGFLEKAKTKLIATMTHHGHSLARFDYSIVINIKIVNAEGLLRNNPFLPLSIAPYCDFKLFKNRNDFSLDPHTKSLGECNKCMYTIT